MSRTWHHRDGLVWVFHEAQEVRSFIMDIVKQSETDSDNLDANEGIVLDARS